MSFFSHVHCALIAVLCFISFADHGGKETVGACQSWSNHQWAWDLVSSLLDMVFCDAVCSRAQGCGIKRNGAPKVAKPSYLAGIIDRQQRNDVKAPVIWGADNATHWGQLSSLQFGCILSEAVFFLNRLCNVVLQLLTVEMELVWAKFPMAWWPLTAQSLNLALVFCGPLVLCPFTWCNNAEETPFRAGMFTCKFVTSTTNIPLR